MGVSLHVFIGYDYPNQMIKVETWKLPRKHTIQYYETKFQVKGVGTKFPLNTVGSFLLSCATLSIHNCSARIILEVPRTHIQVQR